MAKPGTPTAKEESSSSIYNLPDNGTFCDLAPPTPSQPAHPIQYNPLLDITAPVRPGVLARLDYASGSGTRSGADGLPFRLRVSALISGYKGIVAPPKVVDMNLRSTVTRRMVRSSSTGKVCTPSRRARTASGPMVFRWDADFTIRSPWLDRRRAYVFCVNILNVT